MLPKSILNRAVLSLIAFTTLVCTTENHLQVDISAGTVYGLVDGTAPNTAQFLGIPFAEPPVGDLRWLPPTPKLPFGSIRATAFGASCPQYESASRTVYSVDVREFLISGPTSEDCLTLNIWKPLISHGKALPVIVWIYGGGFQTGGGEIAYQIPTQWVERSQKHIVVGINYRLNIFGFPNAAGLDQDELNVGLLDQRLGLEWVRTNIAAFGGDASRITLWGQSAGAMSTDYYNYAYPEDPIISGVILDSGTALLQSSFDDFQHTNFTFVAEQLGCGSLSPIAELTCMRNVSSTEIEGFLKAYNDNGTRPGVAFNPVIDEHTKFSNYTARTLARNFTLVVGLSDQVMSFADRWQPAIIGTNAEEGTSLVTWNPSGANVTAAEELTLSTFLCPAVTTTMSRYAVNATTYRYLYSGNFSNISPRPWEGAYHSSDLPMYFGTTDIVRGASTPFELAVSHRMQDIWVAFASESGHGLECMGWQQFVPGGEAVEFAADDQVQQLISLAALDAMCN